MGMKPNTVVMGESEMFDQSRDSHLIQNDNQVNNREVL